MNAYPFEKLLGIPFHFPVVDKHSAYLRFASDIYILSNRQMVHHVEFLMDDADSGSLRLGDIGEVDLFTKVFDLSRVSVMNSAQDLH